MASTCLYGGPWIERQVKWWNIWMYRIVPLISLASHLILAVFSDIRRLKKRGFRRWLVWAAYQLTDWAPVYVIGNLYIETSRHEKMISAFWVPFLLLHNARPDNISAYSMEDIGLSPRVFIVIPFQTLGSMYLIYRYILVDCTAGLLRQASCIMLFLGMYKYVESAVALWLADLDSIWRSFKQRQPSSFGDDYGGGEKHLDDEEAMLVAHDLFDICKGAFSDYSVDYMDHDAVRNKFSGRTWKSMFNVVEMELCLMYDILYTKAAVVHTWPGYLIRLASPLLTATALLLFGLHHKEGMETEDEVISYILLSTTLLHDVRCLFRALASSWTYSFLKVMPHNWLKHEIWCQGRWKKLRRWVVSLRLFRVSVWLWTCNCKPRRHRGWARRVGQCNILDQCIRRWGTRYSRSGLAKKIESENYLSSLKTPEFPAPTEQPDHLRHGNTRITHMESDEDMIFHPEFQEAILIWHIATDVFLSCSPKMIGEESTEYAKAIQRLSDYMMFLSITNPKILPGCKLRNLYGTTCRTLEMMARTSSCTTMPTKNELAQWMLENKDHLKGTERINKDRLQDTASICVSEGTQIAHALLSQPEEAVFAIRRKLAYWIPELHKPPGNIDGTLEFIWEAWVRLLIYVSIKCSRDSHVKQLSRGGELITLVWIMTEHTGVSVIKSKLRDSLI